MITMSLKLKLEGKKSKIKILEVFVMFHLLLPSEGNRNNSSFVLSNLQESRLSKIEVLQRRVAPTTIVISQCKVRGAEVCGSNDYATGEAPFGVSVTFHLIARPATHAIVE